MKEIYGLKHFDGTMDLMNNFDKVKLSDDIFISRYWYAFIYDDSFLRDYNISKEDILNAKPTLNNGWFRLAIYSEFSAAPHFVFKTPNGEILCLMCLTSK